MRRLLWLSAAALLAAGCSTAPGGGAATEDPPDPRPLGGVLDHTAAESAALHRAEEREVRTCMAGRGFGYAEIPVSEARRTPTPSPYGLLTPGRAARNGYGLTVERLRQPPPDPNAPRLAALTADDRRAWQKALKGTPDGPHEKIALAGGPTLSVPTDSCVTLANRTLYGPTWDRDLFTVQHLRNTIVKNTLARPSVKAAEHEWAACMRDKGFRYEDRRAPLRALSRKLAEAGTDPAALRATGREELRIAAQDAACQTATHLAARIEDAQRATEKALPPSRTAALPALRTALARATAHSTARPRT
ncbi:hypothetical protein ACFUJY_03570 [Streptomyces sp. NPDC057249]|uniref:hypothetical protein n=1 Tax=Streptomyces sp. NPDC057249 TaxID=3346067 RepID=UPI0036354FF0